MTSLWTLTFADDTVSCSERSQVKESPDRCSWALERKGTKLSRSKPECICVNVWETGVPVKLQTAEVLEVR